MGPPLTSAAFVTIEEGSAKPFVCRLCKSAFSERTNCLRHLRTKHKKPEPPNQPIKQQVEEAIVSGRRRTRAELMNPFWIWVIESDVSFRALDSRRLKDFFAGAEDTRIAPVTGDTLRDLILSTAAREKARLITELNAAAALAVSTDTWTKRTGEVIQLILAHYSSPSTTGLRTELLSVVQFSGSKNAEVQATNVRRALEGVDRQPSALVSDNESVMISLAKELKWPRVGCAAHLVALAVSDALGSEELQSVFAFVTTIAKSYRYGNRRDWLRSACEARKIRALRPLLPVKTRWSSLHDAVKRLLHLSEAIRLVAATHDAPDLPASACRTLSAMVAGLSGAAEATKAASHAGMTVADGLRWFKTLERSMAIEVEDDSDDVDDGGEDLGVEVDVLSVASGSDGDDDDETESDSEGDDDDDASSAAASVPLAAPEIVRAELSKAVAKRFRPLMPLYKKAALYSPGGLVALLHGSAQGYENRRTAVVSALPVDHRVPGAQESDTATCLANEELRNDARSRYVDASIRAASVDIMRAEEFWAMDHRKTWPLIWQAGAGYMATPLGSVEAERGFSTLGRISHGTGSEVCRGHLSYPSGSAAHAKPGAVRRGAGAPTRGGWRNVAAGVCAASAEALSARREGRQRGCP